MVEEVVSTLRRSHPSLMTEVERMLDDFSRRFKPEPEEELLGAVHALIIKAVKLNLTREDSIPETLKNTIERVCRKFFFPDPNYVNRKHTKFVQKFKASFERDLLGDTFPTTMTELIHRLKRWKDYLQYRVGGHEHVHLKMEKLSPYLVRFQSYDIDVPGQYLADEEPVLDQTVTLRRFEPDVYVRHTHGFAHRRISMRGSDGKVYPFLVQYSISHITRSDERMMQLYVLLNRMMAHDKETRSRNLAFHVPLVVPLTHRLRLMEAREAEYSFEEVYERSCAARGVDPDEPLLHYRRSMLQVEHLEADKDARHQVFDDICRNIVPSNILAKFVASKIPARDELWAFRKTFAAQLAQSGYLSYIMHIGDRATHKLAFSVKTARVVNSEFYPNYSSSYQIESVEPLPFRLTRNLTTFLTPVIVDGTLTAVLTCSNSCMLRYVDVVRSYLLLFLRDDVLSWNATKVPLIHDHNLRMIEAKLREKINSNCQSVLKRISMLVPPMQDESGSPPNVSSKSQQLVSHATSMRRLASMPASFHPWF